MKKGCTQLISIPVSIFISYVEKYCIELKIVK